MIKAFGIFFLLASCVFAHPHTFIDNYFKISSKNNIITNIHVKWKFDEMSSQLMLMEFDKNGDLVLDKKELAYIELAYFLPLEQFTYYMDIKSKNNTTKFIPTQFNAKIENNSHIIFEFDIHLNMPKENLQIDIYDEDMFTAFMVKKEFIDSSIPFKIKGIDNDFYYSHRISF